VNLRAARVLLVERNADIEADSEWETVRSEVEEADMLYPGPTASFSTLSHSLEPHSAYPHVFHKQSWPASMTFRKAYCTRWRYPRVPADSSKPRRSAQPSYFV
jgi:hypothetical protein